MSFRFMQEKVKGGRAVTHRHIVAEANALGL